MTNHPGSNRVDRVFLDANVLYSAAYKDTSALRKLWELADVKLLMSFYAVDEAYRNLAIDKPGQVERLSQLIASRIVMGDPLTGHTLPPGIDLAEKDRPILLAAITTRARHLLTGDKDHFGRYFGQTIGEVLILRPRDYLSSRTAPS